MKIGIMACITSLATGLVGTSYAEQSVVPSLRAQKSGCTECVFCSECRVVF